jgi:hypothetical protein
MKHDPDHPLAAYGLPTVALSIRQPWAHCIIHHGKDIENRTWSTRFRGPVLIHAAKGWSPSARQDLKDLRAFMDITIPYERLYFGAILGVASISGCVEESDSEWFNGPYGFTLEHVRRLPAPIPCRGALGFFRPNVTAGLVAHQLGEWKLPELELEY